MQKQQEQQQQQQQQQQPTVQQGDQQHEKKQHEAQAQLHRGSASQQAEQAPSQRQLAEQPIPALVQQLGNCTLQMSNSWKRVWQCPDFCGRPCLIKQAQQSSAKHPLLDRKVNKAPCQQDVAGMCRLRKLGLATHLPFHVDSDQCLVLMSLEEGDTLQQRLQAVQEVDAGIEQLLSDLGRVLALMHDGGLVHGNLSSECVLVQQHGGGLVLRDFEHCLNSGAPRDKASDLVLLEASLQQQHPQLPGLFDVVLASYNKHSKQWSAVFNRLPEARSKLLKHQHGPSRKKARKG